MNSENEVVYLYLDDIIPNRFQPREVFDDKALQELSLSIKEHGVIQPIIVRNIGEKYEIIAGERRYKASVLAGLTKIPAIVRNLDDKESSKVALLENLQRKDLTSIEEARTYQKILQIDQMTQEELAKTMGKSQSAVANKLRLLTLPEEVQEALLKERISERHARSLLNLTTPQEQVQMMNQIIQHRMTVRELDQIIREIQQKTNPTVAETSSDNDTILLNQSNDSYKPRFIHLDENNENSNLEAQQGNREQNIVIENDNNTSVEKTNSNSLPFTDLDYLLNIDEKVDSNVQPSLEAQPENDIESIELPDPIILDSPQEEVEELFPVELTSTDEISSSPTTILTAINQIRDLIRNLEKNGFVIDSEEMDFEKSYQVTIKIQKDK